MFAPKKILVPSDFSEFSDNAINEAADIAEKYGSKMILLHVISPEVQQCADQYCMSADLVEQYESASIKHSREALEKRAKAVAESRGIDVSFDVQRGYTSDIILDEQKRLNADLIVIASHGRTGLKKYLMGSVADKVVRSAECPVIVIK